jgi:DNA-directed RNA polymerase subunit E'/Rpb7
MYQVMYIDSRVMLSPSELNIVNSQESVKEILETKLREQHEGKCNSNGFVKPGSLKLLGRSMGVAENGRFTGNLIFDCKMSCDVLYPTAGSLVDATIIKVNKMGAYAVFEEAIRILLPRDLHIGNVDFDALKEGDTVQVRLDRSRFQTKDAFIMAVGRLNASAVARPIAEEEEEEVSEEEQEA